MDFLRALTSNSALSNVDRKKKDPAHFVITVQRIDKANASINVFVLYKFGGRKLCRVILYILVAIIPNIKISNRTERLRSI